METTFFKILNKVITILNLDTQKIAPDFGDPPQKKLAKILSRGTRAIFYSQWRCSIKNYCIAVKCANFCVECLALAM